MFLHFLLVSHSLSHFTLLIFFFLSLSFFSPSPFSSLLDHFLFLFLFLSFSCLSYFSLILITLFYFPSSSFATLHPLLSSFIYSHPLSSCCSRLHSLPSFCFPFSSLSPSPISLCLLSPLFSFLPLPLLTPFLLYYYSLSFSPPLPSLLSLFLPSSVSPSLSFSPPSSFFFFFHLLLHSSLRPLFFLPASSVLPSPTSSFLSSPPFSLSSLSHFLLSSLSHLLLSSSSTFYNSVLPHLFHVIPLFPLLSIPPPLPHTLFPSSPTCLPLLLSSPTSSFPPPPTSSLPPLPPPPFLLHSLFSNLLLPSSPTFLLPSSPTSLPSSPFPPLILSSQPLLPPPLHHPFPPPSSPLLLPIHLPPSPHHLNSLLSPSPLPSSLPSSTAYFPSLPPSLSSNLPFYPLFLLYPYIPLNTHKQIQMQACLPFLLSSLPPPLPSSSTT
ncbi:hypothetical protein C7M84_016183 [Penaeus vannamei]|uniref:Uncharacterized protein n=1 Tax=Penaeus vannamei TaxID=6689 RepID=A0A423SNW8_PENVA|nr:hypothetical protein C7M84_016183 [Penaeus vannamei]